MSEEGLLAVKNGKGDFLLLGLSRVAGVVLGHHVFSEGFWSRVRGSDTRHITGNSN